MAKAHPFTLGAFQCATLSDGPSRTMSLDATFPSVSQEDLDKAKTQFSISTDEVEVDYNVLYIDTGSKKILIDTGLATGNLVQSLDLLKVKPEDIDIILITHGDSDHIGGMLNFPNATYMIPRDAWEQWTHPQSRKVLNDQFLHLFASIRSEDELEAMEQGREAYGANTLPSLEARITLVEPEVDIIKGIRFIEAQGHRSDHFVVEVCSGEDCLIHIVDSIRHPFQSVHPWPSFIDSFPEQIVETNKILVKRIIEKNAKIIGAHFAFPGLAKISKVDDSLSWEWLS